MKKELKVLCSDTQAIFSTEFSKKTGSTIAMVGYSDFISTYNFSDGLATEIDKVYHNNKTGRWLSKLKCTWLPQSDSYFLTGSLEQPRRVLMYILDSHSYSSLIFSIKIAKLLQTLVLIS